MQKYQEKSQKRIIKQTKFSSIKQPVLFTKSFMKFDMDKSDNKNPFEPNTSHLQIKNSNNQNSIDNKKHIRKQ